MKHPLLSSAGSFSKHAAVLISNINDGFINVGNEAPGNDELCKSVNLGEARLEKFLTHCINTHLGVEFKYCGSGEGYKNYT